MAARRSNSAMRGIITSLLSKNVENGAEPAEEEEAVRKALELVETHGFDLKDFELPPRYTKDGKRKAHHPPPKPPASDPQKPGDAPKRPRIVKVAAESALMEIIGTDAEGYTIGHSYADILARVRAEFPTGRTSIKCLRWYAAHMKEQGCKLPQKRERSPAQPKA